jgi:hypothetical protein
MTFFSKTVAESKDAAPGKRQEIYEGEDMSATAIALPDC